MLKIFQVIRTLPTTLLDPKILPNFLRRKFQDSKKNCGCKKNQTFPLTNEKWMDLREVTQHVEFMWFFVQLKKLLMMRLSQNLEL